MKMKLLFSMLLTAINISAMNPQKEQLLVAVIDDTRYTDIERILWSEHYCEIQAQKMPGHKLISVRCIPAQDDLSDDRFSGSEVTGIGHIERIDQEKARKLFSIFTVVTSQKQSKL